jgi:thioredoxin-like negative regulator of GroEL
LTGARKLLLLLAAFALPVSGSAWAQPAQTLEEAPAKANGSAPSASPQAFVPIQPVIGKIHEAGATPDEDAPSVEVLRARVVAAPQDVKAHYALGHALRLSGKTAEAASMLVETTSIEPGMFLAYHELVLCKPSNEQLDEAAERLSHLRDERPHELMLRVALSEVLEQRGDCYAAARALVDLTYNGGVPEKYAAKVQARVHYLLSRVKDAQTAQTAKAEDGGLDALPPPLPESTLRRNIATSKVHDEKQTQSFGHSTLLP